mgnify:CR=1 FL=1
MKKILLSLALLGFAFSATATHIKGGEITFRQTSALTVEAQVHLYLPLSTDVDADSIVFCWGDGHCASALRINGPDTDGDGLPDGAPVPGTDVKVNIYANTHVYENPGTYAINFTHPNRSGGILNLNFPNSDQVSFYLESNVIVTNDDTPNHSPVLYEPIHVDHTSEGQTYYHTPNAFDPDGDSIAYSMTLPWDGPLGEPLPNASINSTTGLISFTPPRRGIYVVVIQISAYRDGVLQDQVIRDMEIFCAAEELQPPFLALSSTAPEQEVLVGDTVTMEAAALSQPFGSPVQLTCTGGLFEYFGTPAAFDAPGAAVQPSGTFQWVVEPEDQREAPYQIVFKARDDSSPIGLSSLIPIRFRVVDQLTSTAPVPEREALKLFPNPVATSIQVEWPAGFQPTAFRIHNAAGQIVQSGAPPAGQPHLDVQSLPKGWYVFALTDAAGKVLQQPFIKQ